jgi:rare lipoprotein A
LRSKSTLRRTRAVQLTIALTMLAVPASAFALTSTDTSPAQSSDTQSSPLTLRTTPRYVRYGDVTNVAGTAPAAAAGSPVVLETAPSGASAWHPLAQTRIGAEGDFRFRVTLRHSGVLRVLPAVGEQSLERPAPTPAPTPAAGAPALSTSALRPVTVAARLRLSRAAHAVLGGQAVNVGGALLPARSGRWLALEGHSAQGWHTLARTRTGGRGGFRFHLTPGTAVARRLRVQFAGDAANGRTSGSAGTVTFYQPSVASWYDDGGSTACGYHAGLGVANRTLPCGTRVQIRYGGRTVSAVVDDRGPYVGGRDWDLNQDTAAALRFSGVGMVWTAA